MYHTNSNQNRAGVAILIPDKVYFETNTVIRDKEHAIVTKGPIHQEDITIKNMHITELKIPKAKAEKSRQFNNSS